MFLYTLSGETCLSLRGLEEFLNAQGPAKQKFHHTDVYLSTEVQEYEEIIITVVIRLLQVSISLLSGD